MCVRAIIFDMDGVLIDAKEWHYDALNEALGLFGYGISRHDHETRFDGLPTKTKLTAISERASLPTALHGFISEMKQRYTMRLVAQRLEPNEIHLSAVRLLKEEGYTLGVASNSIRATIHAMMEQAGLAPYLDFMLSNEDVTHPKPSPQIYLKAMHLSRVSPAECLVLEDNPFGWRAATDAGANLLKIRTVHDVTYQNIRYRIDSIEASSRGYAARAA